MYARAMGWPHVAVYDGGWYEWSSNPHNPVARGERGRKAVSNSPRLSASPFVGDARYPVYAVVVTRFKVW